MPSCAREARIKKAGPSHEANETFLVIRVKLKIAGDGSKGSHLAVQSWLLCGWSCQTVIRTALR